MPHRPRLRRKKQPVDAVLGHALELACIDRASSSSLMTSLARIGFAIW